MTKTQITANVKARHAADEVHRLTSSEARRFTGVAALAFWKRVLANVYAILPPERHPARVIKQGLFVPMTDEESRTFEREAMVFGKYVAVKVSDVPLDYLLWLDGEPDFRRQLNRYLRSERIQREQQ